MTRIVVYTHDLEPITVVSLAPWAMDHIKRHRRIEMVIEPELCLTPMNYEDVIKLEILHITLTAQELRLNKASTWMLFATDEENALLLRSAFLPGQMREVKNREKSAYYKGIFAGFKALGE